VRVTPRALLSKIALQELKKIDTWSVTESLLSKEHLERLEALSKVVKVLGDMEDLTGDDDAAGDEPGVTPAEALALLGMK
jgi:hypothetical protein